MKCFAGAPIFLSLLYLAPLLCQATIRITTTQGNQSVIVINEHQQLRLTCRSTEKHASWSLNDRKLTNVSGTVEIKEQTTQSQELFSELTIFRAEPDDAGTYACFCSHSNARDEVTVKVTGHEHHGHVRIDGPSKRNLELGSQLQLTCRADIHSFAEWFVNDRRIISSGTDQILTTSDEVNNVRKFQLVRKLQSDADFGEYTCRNTQHGEDDKETVTVLRGSSSSAAKRLKFGLTELVVTTIASATLFAKGQQ